jgi:hypothetical protein
MLSSLLRSSALLPCTRAPLPLRAGASALHVCASVWQSGAAAAGAAAPSSAAPATRRDAADASARARAASVYYDPSVSSVLTSRELAVVSSLADEPPPPLMADHGLLYGTTPAQLDAHLAAAAARAAADGSGR